MSSCFLYFGPGAKQAAIKYAEKIGIMLADPIGDDGLKVDEARRVVSLLTNLPVGDKIRSLVVGPVDLALPQASDVLLKRIEEFDDTRSQPVLWANDISTVASTIRSRCLVEYAKDSEEVEDTKLINAGFDLVEAIETGDLYKIPLIISRYKKREHELISSISDALSTGLDKESIRKLWDQFRPLTFFRDPTDVEILAYLVGGFVDQ